MVTGYLAYVVISAFFPGLMRTRVVGHLSTGLCLMAALVAAMLVASVRSGHHEDRLGSPDTERLDVTGSQELWS
ncbi:hypothetical protein V2W30_00970 [Streptomyces sp. Q6]|uniref:Uncharacterized protein n=1 Tax=Streptomyces citrinus TaxID=3118173 RepID=A0ACD5A4H1_9ACTN